MRSSAWTRLTRSRTLLGTTAVILMTSTGLLSVAAASSAVVGATTTTLTTAWNGTSFDVDRKGWVSSSNIVLNAPNTDPTQSMAMGNLGRRCGLLGALLRS